MKTSLPACFALLVQAFMQCAANAADVMPIWDNNTAANTLSFQDTFGHQVSIGTYNPATGVFSIASGSISVGATFTGGLLSISGSPVTGPSGTLAFTVAGTSGGIPYFASGTTWASSAVLAANQLMQGGGAGVAPSTFTLGGDCTLSSPNITCLKTNGVAFGSLATLNAAPAGTLTGATLASNVLASSLTSVGTLSALTIASSGPFPANVPTTQTDTDVLRSYCYRGTGTSHALSTVTSCGGVNTTGFTLLQWQALLPSAAALTDEIDGDAINSYIASIPAGTPIVVPIFGQAMVNTTITACGSSLQIVGSTAGASITETGSGVTLFKYCQSASPPATALFWLSNLQIFCGAAAACGDAVDFKGGNANEPSFIVSNVRIAPTTTTNPWANGLVTVGAGGTRIINSAIINSTGTIAGNCFSVTDSAPFTVIIQVLNTHFYGCAMAEQVTASATTQGIQGVFNIGVNADQVLSFFNYTSTSSTVNPPELVFEQTEVSFFKSLFSEGGAGFAPSDWVIRDGWYIQLAPTANSGAITAPTGLIDLGNSPRVTFDGNSFSQTSGATFNYFINIGASAVDWTIEHNYVPTLLGTINNGIIQIPSGATNILERENDWNYGSTRVVNGAWATSNVLSESYIEDQSVNVCHALTPNRRGTIGSREIICSASISLTLAGTPGVATLTLPTNIFGTTSTTNPILTISNGWTGSALLMCAAETPMTGTPPAATVICFTNTGGNVTGAVRLQYTAVGN